MREVVRSWLLRWRVAGGFTLSLPQIRSGATLRRSAIRICLMLIACGKSSSVGCGVWGVGCCKEQAHPPFQEDWGMCLRRQSPTHPSQAIPLWGVGLYPPPLQREALLAPQARLLRCCADKEFTSFSFDGAAGVPRCRADGAATQTALAKGAATQTMLPHYA